MCRYVDGKSEEAIGRYPKKQDVRCMSLQHILNTLYNTALVYSAS